MTSPYTFKTIHKLNKYDASGALICHYRQKDKYFIPVKTQNKASLTAFLSLPSYSPKFQLLQFSKGAEVRKRCADLGSVISVRKEIQQFPNALFVSL